MEDALNVLKAVKQYLGYDMIDGTDFDDDILLSINGAALELYQVGVLKTSGIMINENTNISDIVSDSVKNNEFAHGCIIRYMGLSTKVFFDPPTANNTNFIKESLKESLWRLESEQRYKEGSG